MAKATELTKKFNETIECLIDAIESEQVTDELNAYYKQAAKFTHYSLRNQVLIMMQDPKATQVAGYKAWNKFDRYVMKGEHGIGILAPHTYTAANNKGVDETHVGFHGTTVFDVRQTDGEPLIDIGHVDGDEGEDLYDHLKTYGESLGMQVTLADDLGVVSGQCTKKTIEVKESLSMQHRIGVLAHEIAHKLSGHHDSDKAADMMEWEAETISYVVCNHFGVKNKAPQYLRSWGATRDGLKESLSAISKISGQIITGMKTEEA